MDFLQASHEVRNINENLTKHEEVPKSLSQLQQTLANCIKQRDAFQSQAPKISNEAEREGEKCSRCSKSWLLHEDKCYLFSNEKKTWNDSKKYCFTQDSTLISINNEREKKFITPLLRDHWIGLSRRDATNQPHWEDGTSNASDPFSKTMSVRGEGSCAFVNNGVIGISICTKLAHFICEKMAIQ
ncbi:C-type lectin domain family 12 member B-like [Alligator mississippiensis]|uniref:C-type lectin domain family 12 member B-like n=1 Tax=Alligator mississippiensis TaxID=8496 RepID=UPI002877F0CE|nr:C-type lectin domain family 12 member B-like [Alligator mississippiensis]